MQYNEKLKEISIKLDQIFLDPNNPRFSDNKIIIPENKISEDKIQEKTLKRMQDFDTDSLVKNIENNGFLKIDRIIVRKIENEDSKYVVIEWNRRITALKTIKNESIEDDLLNSINEIDVLLYEWDDKSITWFLQWIRHISGIKEWTPYQQAVLLEKTIEDENVGITQAWEKYWIWRQISARLLRTLKALENFKNDDEYGEYAQNKHFSIFEEVLKKPTLKEFFDWCDTEKKFKNEERIKIFYEWIQKWYISSAVEDVRKKLPEIILSDNKSLIDNITEWVSSLDDVYIEILSDKRSESIEKIEERFKSIMKDLDNIPSKFFTDKEEKEKLIKFLNELWSKIDKLNNLCQ